MRMRLIDTTPSLLAALLRYMNDRDAEIARVLASREGLDPDADARPRLAVAAHSALVIAANREWRTGDDASAEGLLDAFDTYAGQRGPALSGHWS